MRQIIYRKKWKTCTLERRLAMKKIVSVFLIIVCMSFLVLPSAFALDIRDNAASTDYDSDASSKLTIDSTRMVTLTNNIKEIAAIDNLEVVEKIELSNLSGELEAICYKFKPLGYAIVSYKNGNLIEYSSDARCPFSSGNKNIYNGLFQYFVDTSETLLHTITKEEYLKENVIKILDEKFVSKLPTATKETRSWVQNGITGTLTTAYTTYDGYFCVPTAVAIVLRYLGSYPAGHTDARSYLEDNFYVANLAQWLLETKNGHQAGIWTYTGLQSYFNSGVVNRKTVNVVDYTYSRLNTQVKTNKRPVILEIPMSIWAPEDNGYHAVTAYAIGYYTSNPNETMICVNSGWGDNRTISASYMPTSYDMMYLS